MLTYVFPGQGSQFKGMGEELLNDFKTLTNIASDILGYSIKDLCLNDPHNQLNLTQYTQPALYVVSALSYIKNYEKISKKSDFLAGHSLGEYNALFAAGVFDFETGLQLVKKRGELMSQSRSGGMAAVIGMSIDDIKEIISKNNFSKIDIANINSPIQVVLSGALDEIESAASVFEENKARYIVLPVSAAFHSRYMEETKVAFSEFLGKFNFNHAKIPVISNVSARPYEKGFEKNNLCEQITGAVRWTETVEYLMGRGDMEFKELGPGNVLTNLIAYMKSREEAAA